MQRLIILGERTVEQPMKLGKVDRRMQNSYPALNHEEAGDVLMVTVPVLRDHEVVAVDQFSP
jgi:hypothetical protein